MGATKQTLNRASTYFPFKMALESFDNIYLDLSKESGKCRFAENGFGWKPSGGGDTFTLDHSNIGGAQWSRAAKGYEVKILLRNSGVVQLDGFSQEDFERISKVFKNWYSTNLEHKEHALRGWNWGKGEFGKAELQFNVQNRPAFEIPYSEISNTNLAGKNEVAVGFALPAIGEVAGDTFATFLDVLHLTPRGRFDIDMYENSFRLRGKTYDYKIQYDNLKKFMILPKPNDLHFMICIGLDPPLRQGQTRYPFLVMQFKKDEEVTIDLNMTEELMKEKYKDKLEPRYESPLHQVVTQVS